jgi:hypothetical protein
MHGLEWIKHRILYKQSAVLETLNNSILILKQSITPSCGICKYEIIVIQISMVWAVTFQSKIIIETLTVTKMDIFWKGLR